MRAFNAMLWLALVAGCAGAPGTDSADLVQRTSFGADADVQLERMTLHERGFYFRELAVGTGAIGEPGRLVQVSYVVRLADGRAVDQATPQAPLRFRVGDRSMIPAFDAAVRDMREGGTRQLVVPPRLGYGARGSGPVPGNAVLVIVMRLERVE
jgi:FKBP-type peptidyl-prolyl cis-trans isomerase